MATENILMAAVQAGGDRQDLHERIRTHSQAAAGAAQGGGRRQRPDRPARADPAFPRLDFVDGARPEPVRRPGAGAGRRRSSRARSSRSARRYPEQPRTTARRRRLSEIGTIRSDTADGTSGRNEHAPGDTRSHGRHHSAEIMGEQAAERLDGDQTRAAWRALRRRFNSSRRRRSLGFS